jgi:AbrB family looped-hinge helix DNA binding protein
MKDDRVLPKLATVTSKMQLTIPVRIARKLNLKPGQKVSVAARNGRIVVRPLRSVVEELAGSLRRSTKEAGQ